MTADSTSEEDDEDSREVSIPFGVSVDTVNMVYALCDHD